MNRYITIIIVILTTLLVSGCKGDQVYPMQVLDVSCNVSIVVPSNGMSCVIDIVTNTKWTIYTPTEEWITFSSKSSTGNATVGLTVSENVMGDRSSYVIVSSADGEITRRIDIRQMGYSEGRISLPALLSFERNGGYVFPEEPWSIFGYAALEGAADGCIIVQDASQNPSASVMVRTDASFNVGDIVVVSLSKARLERTQDGNLILSPVSEPENLSKK